jgi:Domain of unknown function (DUF1818)
MLKAGAGWRIGWQPNAVDYPALLGNDEWAIELSAAEFDSFLRMCTQLAETMHQMQSELMDEEAIALELEDSLLWLEAEGYPHAYALHLIVLTGRRTEAHWPATATAELLHTLQTLQVF